MKKACKMKKRNKIIFIIVTPLILLGLLILLIPIIFPIIESIGDYQYTNFSEYVDGYTAIVKKIEENFDFSEHDYNKVFSVYTHDEPRLASRDITLKLTEDEVAFIDKINEEHFLKYDLDYIRVYDNIMIFQSETFHIDELVYSIDGKRPPIKEEFTGIYYFYEKIADNWYIRYQFKSW